MSENQKYVLITGASSGIGQTTAFLLAQKGYKIFAGVRKETDAEFLKTIQNIIPVYIDVNDYSSVERAYNEVSEKCGTNGLYALVNNAGVAVAGPLEFLSIEKFRMQLEINVVGQVKVTQTFLSLIRTGKGRIINISSIAGFTSFPFAAPYCASKHAVEAITDCLRRELSPWKIPVCAISPGVIKTNIWKTSLNILEKSLKEMPEQAQEYYGAIYEPMIDKEIKGADKKGIAPENVAKAILKALTAKNPSSRYLVGADANFLNWVKYLPKKIIDVILCAKSGINKIKCS